MQTEIRKTRRILFVMLFLSSITFCANAQQVTISNNLLYDAWLTPNLRVGMRLSPNWSLGLTAGYRPWPTNDETTRKWRHLLLSPDVRYWTDSVNVHHFFGANLIYSHYNVADVRFPFGMYKSVRDERRQGDLGALGVFYGYSWPLGSHWNIEAIIGAAIGYTSFDRYPCAHCGKKIDSGKKIFLLPQVALNIVFNIPGRKNKVTEPVYISQPPDTVEKKVFTPIFSNVVEVSDVASNRIEKFALSVRFPLGETTLYENFNGNAEALESVIDITRHILADTACCVNKIQIIGLASVEGPIAINENLAEGRALALKNYIQERVQMPDSLIEAVGGGEAWDDFRSQLQEEAEKEKYYAEELQQAIDIIDRESDLDVREEMLRSLNGGRTWQYIKSNILSKQRSSGFIRICYSNERDTNAEKINRANELLRTDCGDCHHEALQLLLTVSDDKRAQNALGVAYYLCGKREEAIGCLHRAAENGDVDAQKNLKEIEKK